MPQKKKTRSSPPAARKILGDGDFDSRFERLMEYQAQSAAEARQRHAEAMERMDKLEAGDRKTRKRIEEAEEARGRAAEEMFRGALPALLKKAGMKVDKVEPRRLRKRDREYDFVARNCAANFVGEVKVRFRAKHLSRLRDLLRQFRGDYPDKAGNRAVYGIVCGLVVDEDAANIARAEGLLVVEGKGKLNVRAKPRKMRDYGGKGK